MNKVIKFFRYLGFSDTSINAEQLLALICLLNEEQPTTLKGITMEQILNEVLDIYINKIETWNLKNITEQDIIEVLANV